MAKKVARAKAKGDRGDKRTKKTKGSVEIQTEQAGDGLSDTSRFWEQMGEHDLAESQRELFAVAIAPPAVAIEAAAVAAEASAVRRHLKEPWQQFCKQRLADAEAADLVASRRSVKRVRPSTTAEDVKPQCEESQDHDAACAETQPDQSADEAELDRSRGFPPGGPEIVSLNCTKCPYVETCGKGKVKGEGVYTFREYYCIRCGAHLTVSTRIEMGLNKLSVHQVRERPPDEDERTEPGWGC